MISSSSREGACFFFTRSLRGHVCAGVFAAKEAIYKSLPALTQRVFTFNGRSQDATAIDAASGKVAGTIPLGGRPEFAVADGKGQLFVNLEDKSEILALDAHALSVLHRWPLAPGEGPSGLAMDRAHRRCTALPESSPACCSDCRRTRLATREL